MYGTLISCKDFVFHGMFNTVTIPVQEMNVYGGRPSKPYPIPTMKDLVIMFGNETGDHNSGRIKVASADVGSQFKSKRNYYEVYYDKGKVVLDCKGGNPPKIKIDKKR